MMKFQVVPLITLSSPKGIGRSRSRRIPMIPNEVRRKIRNGSFHRSQEPSSPKVSCFGEVKHKQYKKEKQNDSKHEGYHIPLPTKDRTKSPCPDRDRKCKRESLNEKKKRKQQQEKPFCFSKLTVCWFFKQKVWVANPCVPEPEMKPPSPQENAAAPSLCRMKSLASGSGALSNFDWKVLDASPLQKDDRAMFFR